MRRGFVYAPGPDQPHSTATRPQTLAYISPRKRKRSPEQGVGPGLPDPHPRQQLRGPKTAKTVAAGGSGGAFNDESDDEFALDELGAAALEQYELTQGGNTADLSPIPDPYRPSTSTFPNPVSNRNQRWTNPYQTQSDTAEPPPTKLHGITQSTSGRTNQTGGHVSPLPQTTGSTANDDLENVQRLHRQIAELQELMYTRDGEVTVLRGEKDRLVGEVRKREGLMQEMHTHLLADQKAMEQQLTREKQSLATEMKFKEQELMALQQKCAMLEQKQKGQTGAHAPPAPGQSRAMVDGRTKGHSSGRGIGGKEGRVEFLSTETFMPLSQMGGSEVTTVAVGQRRESLSVQGLEGDRPSPRGTTAPLDPPAPLGTTNQNALTSMMGKVSEPTHPQVNSEVSDPTPLPPPPSGTVGDKDCPIVLDLPNPQLNGTELLMLLVQRDLLKIPTFPPEEAGEDGEEREEEVATTDTSPNQPSTNLRSLVKERLPGLLSLLHVPSQISLSSTATATTRIFPSVLTTPVSSSRAELSISGSSQNTSGGSLRPMPPLDSSIETTPKTPISRRSRLLPLKPHTCARSDISRARNRQLVPPRGGRSLSAANTPIHDSLEQSLAGSLASSINMGGLEDGIASLLRSTDSSKVSVMFRRPNMASLTGVWSTPLRVKHCRGEDSSLTLLPHIGNIITRYYSEQLAKARASYASGMVVTDHTSDIGDTLEGSSVLQSPKPSLSACSTTSSRFSQDFSPLLADQELASQALGILETLVRYSRTVREQLVTKPLEFDIDSRPSPADDPHPMRKVSTIEEECMIVETGGGIRSQEAVGAVGGGMAGTPRQGPGWRKGKEWEGQRLIPFEQSAIPSNKVWVPAIQEHRGTSRSGSVVSLQVTPIGQAVRSSGQLFSTLLELTAPPWRESVENSLECLRILTAVAEDCSMEALEMFSPLLLEDTLYWCLEREDCLLTLSSLFLLTHMGRSPTLVGLLCQQEDSCILLSCYSCFLDPPSGPTHLVHRIHIQLLCFISTVLMVSNGPKVVFESPTCPCSHELLRSMVAFLNRLVEDIFQPRQLSQQRLALVRELVSLLQRVSAQDRDYDTHREACHHQLTFVLNKLAWLFGGIPSATSEVLLVSELLESCEETDDSQEGSEKMDEG